MNEKILIIRKKHRSGDTYNVISGDPDVQLYDLATRYAHRSSISPEVKLKMEEYENIEIKEISVKKGFRETKFHAFMINNATKDDLKNTQYYMLADDPTRKDLCKIYLIPFEKKNSDVITFYDPNDLKMLSECKEYELFDELLKWFKVFFTTGRMEWLWKYADGNILCKMDTLDNGLLKYSIGFERNYWGPYGGQFDFIIDRDIELHIFENMYRSFINQCFFDGLKNCINKSSHHGNGFYQEEAEKYGMKTILINCTVEDYSTTKEKRMVEFDVKSFYKKNHEKKRRINES